VDTRQEADKEGQYSLNKNQLLEWENYLLWWNSFLSVGKLRHSQGSFRASLCFISSSCVKAKAKRKSKLK
jgi:hypothetical protein